MAYVKLDCGILDSTIWFDKPARDVFVTALLMATPCEYTEPEPQIEVRTLDDTGWMVPPGWYGFVAAAGIGITDRAGVEREAGLDALERMGAPEPDSRSQDFDGRRMVRVDGGYLILNFQRYRDKDHTAAERARRYRKAKKARESASGTKKRHTVTPRNHAVTSRNVTQAEAEAEAEKNTYGAGFLACWEIYPKRSGSNSKAAAWKAYRNNGATDAVLLDATQRYAAWCEATGKIGTEKVMGASRFYGPRREWENDWAVPADSGPPLFDGIPWPDPA